MDDGPGLPAQGAAAAGVGLANTRARLEQLYGKRHRFDMRNRAEGGLRIAIVLPFRRSDGGAA
jgi:LytS/YehU family sensor histidine kinase